jgi:hypothetical protein
MFSKKNYFFAFIFICLSEYLIIADEPKFKQEPGSILVEYWFEVNGGSIKDLTGNPNYPEQPSKFQLAKNFEILADQAESYGSRIRGYLLPPETGDYIFWLSADDTGELWLSDSAEPKSKKLLITVDQWSGTREWEKYPNQKSVPVRLEKGKKYYVEALHKEGGGGDNLSVGWQLPGGAKELPIPGNRLEPCSPPKITPISMNVVIKVNTPLPTKPGYNSITGTYTYGGKEFPFGAGIYLPEDYASIKDKLPLITTLHNVVGEDGGVTGDPIITREGMAFLMLKDIGLDQRHGGDWPAVKFNPRKDAKFIGLIPQCPKDRGFQSMPMSGVIVELINWVEKNYSMDPDRVYLTGFSYGGACTWAVAQQFPERFAAIVPLSARLAPQPELSPEILKNIGVWCAVGQNDGDFFNSCNQMSDHFTKAKHPNFHFNIIKNGNHHCYQSTYGNPDFWKWLLAQKRKPIKVEVKK